MSPPLNSLLHTITGMRMRIFYRNLCKLSTEAIIINWMNEEFDSEIYDYRGKYIGLWRIAYQIESDQYVFLYPYSKLDRHENGGNKNWRQR